MLHGNAESPGLEHVFWFEHNVARSSLLTEIIHSLHFTGSKDLLS